MSDPITTGQRAEALLNDPLVVGALDSIRDATRDLFFDLAVEDEKGRQMLHLMDRARQQFVRVFELHILGAHVAKNELMAEEHAAARIDAIRRKVSLL